MNYKKLDRKVKETTEKTRNVSNNDESRNYILRGEKNSKFIDRILCKSTKATKTFLTYTMVQSF